MGKWPNSAFMKSRIILRTRFVLGSKHRQNVRWDRQLCTLIPTIMHQLHYQENARSEMIQKIHNFSRILYISKASPCQKSSISSECRFRHPADEIRMLKLFPLFHFEKLAAATRWLCLRKVLFNFRWHRQCPG